MRGLAMNMKKQRNLVKYNKMEKTKGKISRKTKLGDVIRINEKAAEVLFSKGLSCIGCPMATQETIEQGCKAHGMNNKEIDELLNKINK